MAKLTFYSGDKVKLVNGMTATVVCKCKKNKYYYRVKAYDSFGKLNYYNIFVMDMKLVKRNNQVYIYSRCFKCGSKELFVLENHSHIGLYCGCCGRWLKWLNNEELLMLRGNKNLLISTT